MAETKYLSVTETAKLIRAALKEAFPEIKFSVRSDKYSMGASIDVSWIDGPTSDQVKAIAGVFAGATFDGMTDYKGGKVHRFRGELVHFGADFVHFHREIAAVKKAALIAELEPLSKDTLEQVAFKTLGQGWHHFRKEYDNAERLAWLILHNAAAPAFEGRASTLAKGVEHVRSY